MPTITINRKEFEKLVGKKLDDDSLKDRISMLGTDLEKIEGNDIVVEIFPNRPDMLSEQGFARAFASFIGVKTGLREYKVRKSDYRVIVEPSVKKVRPYTMCAIVKNLKFDDEKIREIIQLQEKLHVTFCRNRKKAAIGIYPLEKIRLPIYYRAKKPKDICFVPLEMDKKLNGLQILGQHPTGREFAHLLEGKDLFPVFEDADGNVLSMPPIINSHMTGKVCDKTTDVFIETSGFDMKAQSRLLNIILCSLADMGGEIHEMVLEYPDERIVSPEMQPELWDLDLAYINRRLGLELSEPDVKKLLGKMGFGYSKGRVSVPCYRADIMHQVDFVEDIAIAYGFESFKEEIPEVSTIAREDIIEIFRRKIAHILLGLGLLEVNSYHISNKDVQCSRMLLDADVVELKNALTSDYNVLRYWIVPNHLEILARNKSYEYPQDIFEINTVFRKGDTETGVREDIRLCVTLCSAEANFTKIKQVLDYLFANLGLVYGIDEVSHPSFIPGRVGRVSVGNEKIAFIGEMHPQVLQNFSLDYPVAVLELDITGLFGRVEKNFY
ncbi:phenylalanine--tRNA ligase subunit beta [Candidatus Woesearchaeota archaeon]|nr:phenylalanine--tRNA ligase subunit beta [Candidatus Woesearchaeota archaeon]